MVLDELLGRQPCGGDRARAAGLCLRLLLRWTRGPHRGFELLSKAAELGPDGLWCRVRGATPAG